MENLLKIAEWIEQNKSIIVQEWIEDANIIAIFKKNNISTNKFSTNFAVKILEYSISVMRSQKEIGNCPVMNKFVNYMIQHEITSQEILQICTPLRSIVLLNLFKTYPNFSEDLASIKEILKIFDANLSGVLKNYDQIKSKLSSASEQKNLNLKTYLSRLQTILNTQENIIFKLHGEEIFIGNKSLYRTVGVENLEQFKKKYPQPLSFIKSVNYADSIFQEQNYEEWINLILTNHQGQCKTKLFNKFTNQTSMMHIKISKIGDDNDYVFTIQDLAQTHNKQNKNDSVSDVDALTNLSNLKGFEELLEEKLKDTRNQDLKILMIELHGLSLYSEQNSVEQAEKIVTDIAKTLQDKYDDEVARIDYNRFVILNNNLTLEVSNELVKEIDSIISGEPNAQSINVNAAIVLLKDSDTLNNVIHHGEMLLHHLKKQDSRQVIDDNIITQAEAKRLQQEKKFLSLMKEYKTDKKTLPVTNYYLEIPLKSVAKIISISEKEMILDVRKIAAVALHKHDHIYISMPEKPNYRATIKKVNIEKNQIVLERFEAIESSALDRKNIHVKLSDPLEVLVKSDKVQILEDLESASVDTFVIIVNHLYNIEKDSKVSIFATLLNEQEEEFIGHVYKIIPIADKFKLIIHLDKTKSIQNSLVPFISQRQIEIIKELQDKTSY
jgi:GGDEF domain-containing protein